MVETKKEVARKPFRKRFKNFLGLLLCGAIFYSGYYFYVTHEGLFDSMREKKYNLRYVNEDIVVMEVIIGNKTSTVVYYAKKEGKNHDASE